LYVVLPLMLGFMIAGWIIHFLALTDSNCYDNSKKFKTLIQIDRIVLMLQLLQLTYMGYGLYEIIMPIYTRFIARKAN